MRTPPPKHNHISLPHHAHMHIFCLHYHTQISTHTHRCTGLAMHNKTKCLIKHFSLTLTLHANYLTIKIWPGAEASIKQYIFFMQCIICPVCPVCIRPVCRDTPGQKAIVPASRPGRRDNFFVSRRNPSLTLNLIEMSTTCQTLEC